MRNIIFLFALAGLVLFGAPGQVNAQTANADPGLSYKLYALDANTNGAITAVTKHISLGVIFTNNSPNTIFRIRLVLNHYTIFNRSSYGVWGRGIDTSAVSTYLGDNAAVVTLTPFTSKDSGILVSDDALDFPLKIDLINTSTRNGLVVKLDYTVSYTLAQNGTTQNYTGTVSDLVYTP